MVKIKLEELMEILNRNILNTNTCVEMNFGIDDDEEYEEYEDCWLGKMPDKENCKREIYWYGLVEDGSQAYEYDNLKEFLNAKVFHEKSLLEVFDKITWYFLND